MKRITIIVISVILLVGASSVMAGQSASGKWAKQQRLSSEEDYSSLKAGAKLAMVCKACDSVSVLEIETQEQAMEFCKDGESVDCPSCDNVAKITRRSGHGNSPNPPRGRPTVVYVDDHGEACMVMAKLDEN